MNIHFLRSPFSSLLAFGKFGALALFILLSACSESFTDSRDGQSYGVVKIGEQTWMAKNLNYATEGSACPDGDTRNCKRLGRLYTWAEAKTVCPEGWRLPTKADFEKLIAEMLKDGMASSKGDAGAALKAKDGWFKKGNGSDVLGFKAQPAGFRGAISKADDGAITGGKFDGIGGYAYFWSATEDEEFPESLAYYLFLSFSSDAASLNAFAKEDYRSVRCVQ
ncbi:MAG: fibrobacter succinogenes major paralogous domain-containing protein [Fibrobacter sp.]|nr:fibrobacter succinogenes major paralogous domain-containing protein [Fibrobacter sp.]